jgi:hypothetical protein
MKTNAQEREAIAKKFYKRLVEKAKVSTAEFKKTKEYKEIVKTIGEINSLNKKTAQMRSDLEVRVSVYNECHSAEHTRLMIDSYYRNGSHQEGSPRLEVDSSYVVEPEIRNAILLAQVESSDLNDIFSKLDEEFEI